ncbi:MAG: S24/S26 family peptidase [Candidatus Omnitrophota bacterium]
MEQCVQSLHHCEELKKEGVRLALKQGKTVMLEASGRCMRPFLRAGDSIQIGRAEEKDLKLGDIVVFEDAASQSHVYSHRIIKKLGGLFLSKADACFWPDKPFVFEKILGRVSGRERKGHFFCFNAFYRIIGFLLCYFRLSWFYFAFLENIRSPQLIPTKVFKLLHPNK